MGRYTLKTKGKCYKKMHGLLTMTSPNEQPFNRKKKVPASDNNPKFMQASSKDKGQWRGAKELTRTHRRMCIAHFAVKILFQSVVTAIERTKMRFFFCNEENA